MNGSFCISGKPSSSHVTRAQIALELVIVKSSWIACQKYWCDTRSRLPGEWFHARTKSRTLLLDIGMSFCTGMKISLRHSNQSGWTHTGMTRTSVRFCAGIIEANTKPQEGTRVNSYRHESRADIMWTPPYSWKSNMPAVLAPWQPATDVGCQPTDAIGANWTGKRRAKNKQGHA